MSKIIYEGWMVRYGRRKIGRSFIHMRYFVLESRVLAYYKRKPQDNVVPIKTLHIDGNCRVEDRGLKTQHGRSVYALSIYNKKDKYHGIKMAAFNIQETQSWKEKIQAVIDQQEELFFPSGNQASPFEYKPGVDNGRTASSSDHDSQYSEQEDEGNRRILLRRTTIGNGPPDSVFDWTRDVDSELTNSYSDDQVFHKKHWRLVRCQNGLRIFEELLEMDYLPRSCSRAMKAVGVIEATCSEIFELLMSTDGPRFEWDCCFQYGRVVKEVDGHTAILYQRLQLDWFPLFVWPRDLCYVRYWRRNDDGSYVVLFRSTEHENWGPQPGYVRAHVESGGFIISPLKSSKGRSRSKVQHLMQIDLKGWGVGYFPSFKQHSLFQMLNSVAGLREWFAQTDGSRTVPRIPMIVKMASDIVSSEKGGNKSKQPTLQREASRQFGTPDDESDEDDEFQFAETTEQENGFTDFEHEANKSALDEEAGDELDLSGLSGNLRYNERDGNQDCWRISDGKNFRVRSRQFLFEKTKKGFAEALDEEPEDKLDLSGLSGNLRYDERDGSRDCWRISDGNNFRVRSRQFLFDKTKIPAGKHLMNLAAVDWFKDTRRMDHVARRKGCAVHVASERGLFTLVFNLQVPGSTHYSMVFYFVSRKLEPGSLLQRFVDGDDEFRNSRMKLIPSVPKGSWIVRQSVGSTPCLLGKAVDCNYIRGPKYLEIDVDIGSSTVANGVLGLVCGVITTLVVDMAFLVQANTLDELPERLIGAVRVSHVELSSAVVPVLDATPIVE